MRTGNISSTSYIMEDLVNIKDFIVFPLRLENAPGPGHCLYVKENTRRERDPDKPNGKTLFVMNLPPYIQEEHLQELFSDFGKVVRVFIQKSPSLPMPDEKTDPFFPSRNPCLGFKMAYVVFKTSQAIKKIKSATYDQLKPLTTPIHTGINKWTEAYGSQYPDPELLQKNIERFMEPFDKKEAEETQRAKDEAGKPDEEGWITVTRHSKKKVAPHTEDVNVKVKQKIDKSRKERELLNFYTFQIRESKKNKIDELRKKFDEDKERIAQMKAARKFRPY